MYIKDIYIYGIVIGYQKPILKLNYILFWRSRARIDLTNQSRDWICFVSLGSEFHSLDPRHERERERERERDACVPFVLTDSWCYLESLRGHLSAVGQSSWSLIPFPEQSSCIQQGRLEIKTEENRVFNFMQINCFGSIQLNRKY